MTTVAELEHWLETAEGVHVLIRAPRTMPVKDYSHQRKASGTLSLRAFLNTRVLPSCLRAQSCG